jgi:DNA mismatch repair ATPase MutS
MTRLLQLSYELDALVSLADVTGENDLVMPTAESGAVMISATGLVHPALFKAVPNRVELTQRHRVLFLTGPNMAGKTTYLRAIITALYFAHIGMGVPATRFNFVPVQRLLTSISLRDDLRDGISYFRAEALRVKAVAEAIAAGFRTIAVMDEPFKGTNVKDAFDASLEVLKRFAYKENCLFIVSSHLIELGERLKETSHIDYQYFEANEDKERLSFDFLLHRGISSQRLGMRVLGEEGVFALLDAGQNSQDSA